MGFSVGGEYTGVVAYLLEGARPERRGLIASLASAASEIGALLAVGISALTVSFLSPSQLDDWGWRIPFLFGAALEAIPQSYLDAAAIDGASPWQRFWRIKLPLNSPTLCFGTVMTAITSLQVFDQVYALTRGGPGSATATLGFSIYRTGFAAFKMGYASAIAWALFLVIRALTILQLRVQRRWVHYDL